MTFYEYIILFIMAFLPPIIYTVWIRNTEKYNREKWTSIFYCFIWGATISVIAAIVLEYIFDLSVIPSLEKRYPIGFITIVLIAPFIEEFTKPLALRTRFVKKELDELEDGLIYGAVAGLGFSATENLLYGWTFLNEGIIYFLILISIRSIGGCLLHASATAWTGYGYGKNIIKGTSIVRVLPYFIIAFLIHAFYNGILVFNFIGIATGLFAAIIFTLITIKLVRSKIRKLDMINK